MRALFLIYGAVQDFPGAVESTSRSLYSELFKANDLANVESSVQ